MRWRMASLFVSVYSVPSRVMTSASIFPRWNVQASQFGYVRHCS